MYKGQYRDDIAVGIHSARVEYPDGIVARMDGFTGFAKPDPTDNGANWNWKLLVL
jgi:hypothetical protein